MFSFSVRPEEVGSVTSLSWAGLRIYIMLLCDPILQNMPAGKSHLLEFANVSDYFLTVKLLRSARTEVFQQSIKRIKMFSFSILAFVFWCYKKRKHHFLRCHAQRQKNCNFNANKKLVKFLLSLHSYWKHLQEINWGSFQCTFQQSH